MGKGKVPELRFRGFDGAWDRQTYDKVFTFLSNNTLSRAELNYEYGAARNIHYGDVLVKYREILDLTRDEVPFITNAEHGKRKQPEKLQNGDIILADTAEDETVGKCTELVDSRGEVVLAGLHTLPCRPLQEFARAFLGYSLNSPAFHDQLLRLMQGTKVLSISKAALLDTELSYPVTKREQGYIGELLKGIDAMVVLHGRKHDKLLAVKKSMLEKMFPQEGAEVPEIRFKGFAGKWKRKKIGTILAEARRPVDLNDDTKYELVTVRRRNEGVVPRGSLLGREILVKNYYEVRSGDFLISKRQIVHGANGLVPKGLDKAIVSNEYLVIVDSQDITTDYWALISSLPEMYRIYFISSYGVDIEKLVFDVDDWKKRAITIPAVEEQNAIVNFFQNLDSLISLQAQELDKLKNLKKALLDKMFV